MPNFSDSGLYQLPVLTTDALASKDSAYSTRLKDWLAEAVQEGDSVNMADPNYEKIAIGLQYVSGDQQPNRDQLAASPYLQGLTINLSRKAMQAHVSALTDVKPTFGWRSMNPKYQFQAQLLNQLAIAWWLNRAADVKFGDVVKYAWAGGTGDMMIEWNPMLSGGGDHDVIPKDPRDTLPLRPSRYSDEQSWQGVTFREVWSVNALREKYPLFSGVLRASDDGLLGSIKGLFMRRPAVLQTPADPLANLGGGPRGAQTSPPRTGDMILYKSYLDDRSRNLTSRPIVMGDPTKTWSYTVEPMGLMYPQKRLVVWTPEFIIYDGPNPYWHGKYPFARLHLWKLPWFFLGQPALADLIPLQDGVNLAAKQMKDGIALWMDQQVVLDRNQVGQATSHVYDSRKPGFKFNLAKGGMVDAQKAVTKIDGPNPQAMNLNFQWYLEQINRFEYLSGTANLQQLMQLRQMPGADTLEKYYEALTPELRMEGRMFEGFLRQASHQICFNTFQFMDSTRRVTILGDAGLALEDFDFDPDNLVPAMQNQQPVQQPDPMTGAPVTVGWQPNPDYDPNFDANQPRAARAKAMAALMVFVVAPNSVLAFNAQEEKMMRFQLARMGYYDFWSLMETLEIPNVGTPPPIPLPPLTPPSQEDIMAAMGASLGIIPQMPGAPPPKYIFDPASGQILENRVPLTVTERLMAQQLLGIGMTENPAGRKASGQSPPKNEQKDGGTRTTVTESEK